jgi:hypothetical protein
MTISIEATADVKRNGCKIAKLRNDGALCDIHRHGSGFLYSGGFRVALSEELLESLPDTTILQFTNLDTKDVYTITVHDFRQSANPIHYSGYELQRACEILRMNHTIEGKPKKTRKNELVHVDETPIHESRQPSLFG